MDDKADDLTRIDEVVGAMTTLDELKAAIEGRDDRARQAREGLLWLARAVVANRLEGEIKAEELIGKLGLVKSATEQNGIKYRAMTGTTPFVILPGALTDAFMNSLQEGAQIMMSDDIYTVEVYGDGAGAEVGPVQGRIFSVWKIVLQTFLDEARAEAAALAKMYRESARDANQTMKSTPTPESLRRGGLRAAGERQGQPIEVVVAQVQGRVSQFGPHSHVIRSSDAPEMTLSKDTVAGGFKAAAAVLDLVMDSVVSTVGGGGLPDTMDGPQLEHEQPVSSGEPTRDMGLESVAGAESEALQTHINPEGASIPEVVPNIPPGQQTEDDQFFLPASDAPAPTLDSQQLIAHAAPDSSSDGAKALSWSQIPVVASEEVVHRPSNPALLQDAVHPLDRGDFLTPLPRTVIPNPSKK